jgi:superoxide oxidase
MSWKNTELRFGTLSIGLHWLMVLLIAGVYACIELKGFFPKGSGMRDGLKQWHFMLGLAVFALVWLRITARLLGAHPKVQPPVPSAQDKIAKLMYLALYALMIGAPFAGWLMLSAYDKPIPFFGLQLPALLSPDQALGSQIKDLHELAGSMGYWLIGLHAIAGLYHHYIRRDNTLRMMLPERK